MKRTMKERNDPLTRRFDSGLPGIWWGIFAITRRAASFTMIYTRRLPNHMDPNALGKFAIDFVGRSR